MFCLLFSGRRNITPGGKSINAGAFKPHKAIEYPLINHPPHDGCNRTPKGCHGDTLGGWKTMKSRVDESIERFLVARCNGNYGKRH